MPDADFLVGRILHGRYRIDERLGAGGMGVVFRACQLEPNRDVALKVIEPAEAANKILVARFQNEIEAMARVNHPNVVQLIDSGKEGDLHYVVMELLSGRSLREEIKLLRTQGNPEMPWLRALHILHSVAKGLAAVHKVGVVHRDVKPENIFLTQAAGVTDLAKLLDFGIARGASMAGQKSLTQDGSFIGTPGYLSPEQLNGDEAKPWSDFYAIGVILYELVTGQHPFQADSSVAIMQKQLNETVTRPGDLVPDLPLGVATLIESLMSRDPEQRLSFEQLDHKIDDLVAGSAWRARVPLHLAGTEPMQLPAHDAHGLNRPASTEPLPHSRSPVGDATVAIASAPDSAAPLAIASGGATAPTEAPMLFASTADDPSLSAGRSSPRPDPLPAGPGAPTSALGPHPPQPTLAVPGSQPDWFERPTELTAERKAEEAIRKSDGDQTSGLMRLDANQPEPVADVLPLADKAATKIPPRPRSGGRRASAEHQFKCSKTHATRILNGIPDPESDDDPLRPEFPPRSPRYPATPMRHIEHEFVKHDHVFIKDESWCPTGSHKDRWAWEMLLRYKATIAARIANEAGEWVILPPLSMISSGSAALALQSLLRQHGLPPLRVVMDGGRAQPGAIATLQSIGAIVYPRDLDQKPLTERDVLEITENLDGEDITTRNVAEPERRRFFDWLACEILDIAPRHIFVPVGTGDLYANIAFIIEKEVNRKTRDLRISRACERGISLHGATTNESKSRLDKLYAKFRPTYAQLQRKIGDLRTNGILDQSSGIEDIPDDLADEAVFIARTAKINTELSGIAGLALFLRRHRETPIPPRNVIVIVNTGWMHVPPALRRSRARS